MLIMSVSVCGEVTVLSAILKHALTISLLIQNYLPLIVSVMVLSVELYTAVDHISSTTSQKMVGDSSMA